MSLTPRRRSDDRLPYRIWKGVRRVLMFIGIAVVMGGVSVAVSLRDIDRIGKAEMTQNMVLAFALDGELKETPEPPSLLNPNIFGRESLRDVIRAIDLAAGDARVKGIVLRLDGLGLSLAQVQELRGAVMRLRQAQKFAMIHAADYGGLGTGGASPYYLASAFGQIWLQPAGSVTMAGIALQVPFFKGLMDKLGLRADMVHKGRYKSAPESVTNETLSADSRENLESLLENLSTQISSDIGLARGIDESGMAQVQRTGIFTAEAALAARLVDNIGYSDEMIVAAKTQAGMIAAGVKMQTPDDKGRRLTPLLAYLDTREDELDAEDGEGFFAALAKEKRQFMRDENGTVARNPDGRTIALVMAAGEIADDSVPPAMAAGRITPQLLREAFASLQDDADVRAVVLRIDSPGGSASASESIRRLVTQARLKNIPVVVSMSGAAASGGYWIASAADRIVAQPATLTGSIGVFGGKIVIGGAMNRWGVNIETLKSGPRADLWTATRAFSDEERAAVDALMQNTYDAFLTRVSEGRNLDRATVAKLAEGRVYTGQQAKQAGLVDALGGLDVALREAKALANIPPDAKVDLKEYPAQKGPLAKVMALLSGQTAFMPLSAAVMQEAQAQFDMQARNALLLSPVDVR